MTQGRSQAKQRQARTKMLSDAFWESLDEISALEDWILRCDTIGDFLRMQDQIRSKRKHDLEMTGKPSR